jgi:hypothetical protein
MSLKEKFQAVFTWKLKKPTFEVGKSTTPKEKLQQVQELCLQQKRIFKEALSGQTFYYSHLKTL